MQFDHVVKLVADPVAEAADLLDRYGLGSERGPYHPFAGTRNHTVPLHPPEYLELLSIENRAAAESTDTGRAVLACAAPGFGLCWWSVLVVDLDAVSRRLGIEIFDYTIPHGDGTLRGWRTVSGPRHLPFFIDYPNNGDRAARYQAMYDRVGHTSAPTGFAQLTLGGSEQELRDWLGPHDLPLHFVDGPAGIHEAHLATSGGRVVLT